LIFLQHATCDFEKGSIRVLELNSDVLFFEISAAFLRELGGKK
jgi:hypothetical protein